MLSPLVNKAKRQHSSHSLRQKLHMLIQHLHPRSLRTQTADVLNETSDETLTEIANTYR
jgi:hypothetical protein